MEKNALKFVDQLVVPGDAVFDLSNMANATIKLGGGLRQECDTIEAMKAGILKFAKPNKYWVESSQKRYVPCVEDHVLGIVVDTKADNFLVDIKGPAIAFLPVLAFEGGTRRNIPKYELMAKHQDLVFSKTDTCSSRQQAFHECCSAHIHVQFSIYSGKKLSFEIAVGLNGRVWINGPSPSIVILVANAVMNSEALSGGAQQRIMVWWKSSYKESNR